MLIKLKRSEAKTRTCVLLDFLFDLFQSKLVQYFVDLIIWGGFMYLFLPLSFTKGNTTSQIDSHQYSFIVSNKAILGLPLPFFAPLVSYLNNAFISLLLNMPRFS